MVVEQQRALILTAIQDRKLWRLNPAKSGKNLRQLKNQLEVQKVMTFQKMPLEKETQNAQRSGDHSDRQ